MEGMKKFGLQGNYIVIPNTVFFSINNNGHIGNHLPLKITTIGCNAEQYKNVLGIIQSYAAINGQLPDSILQIIGYGSAKKMLERAAAETGLLDKRIFFLGKIRNENVYSILGESAFVVVNSRSESFSMAAAEAIACGTPVLSTRCGGPEEFIDENNGHLIEPGNNQQLTQAIVWMSSHFNEFNREGIRRRAQSRFSEETIGKKFYELYLSALSHADKSR
jgi:glycosyltransferase involved in cell wall biosynthesis